MSQKVTVPGTFCWADLVTTNISVAIEFYGNLFGWQTQESSDGSNYMFFTKEGKHVCGISQMSKELEEGGMPSMWNGYIATKDVDATLKKVEENGGKVILPAMSAGESGRMAMIAEPTGAVVGLWQANQHAGFEVTNETASTCWFELATREPQKSIDFFTAIFGWEAKEDGGAMKGYTTLRHNDAEFGGIIQMTETWGDLPSHWTIYFYAKNVEESAQKAENIGGKICVPVTDIPVGRFSMINDPQGAAFTIFEDKA